MILNAKIRDVNIELDDSNTLSAKMTFTTSSGSCGCSFCFLDAVDSHKLIKLLQYTEVSDFEALLGKIIRISFGKNSTPNAIGHPIEDKFFSTASSEKFEELTEAQLS